MISIVAALTAFLLIDGAAAAAPTDACDVPKGLLSADVDLTRVAKAIKGNHRLDIVVIGSGSSSLTGTDGARYSYPARLQDALMKRLPGNEIKVTTHVRNRETTSDMAAGLGKILSAEKPALVIWQTGTADAINGVESDDFRASLDGGVETIQKASSDVILMNMQYSPRTESMLDVSGYADIMRWVAQQRSALLFDRLAVMRYWNDAGTFDLYAATKNYDMARSVHDCIGRALASQIIDAAHLDAVEMQTTR
jgi:hypothetical protein